jgi:hypothetical protein
VGGDEDNLLNLAVRAWDGSAATAASTGARTDMYYVHFANAAGKAQELGDALLFRHKYRAREEGSKQFCTRFCPLAALI